MDSGRGEAKTDAWVLMELQLVTGIKYHASQGAEILLNLLSIYRSPQRKQSQALGVTEIKHHARKVTGMRGRHEGGP